MADKRNVRDHANTKYSNEMRSGSRRWNAWTLGATMKQDVTNCIVILL